MNRFKIDTIPHHLIIVTYFLKLGLNYAQSNPYKYPIVLWQNETIIHHGYDKENYLFKSFSKREFQNKFENNKVKIKLAENVMAVKVSNTIHHLLIPNKGFAKIVFGKSQLNILDRVISYSELLNDLGVDPLMIKDIYLDGNYYMIEYYG